MKKDQTPEPQRSVSIESECPMKKSSEGAKEELNPRNMVVIFILPAVV